MSGDRRQTGRLPPAADDGRWHYWASFATILRGQIVFGKDVHEVRREVAAQGYGLRKLHESSAPQEPSRHPAFPSQS